MDKLCKDTNILKLLNEDKSLHPEDTIPFCKSFPHEYIPDTITKTERFINFDISTSLDLKNRVLKDMKIYFFIVCHEYVVKYYESGRMYLWYDKVVCALDELFSDQNVLGIGNMQLISDVPYYPQEKFKGRQLVFTVKDFTDGAKYGK